MKVNFDHKKFRDTRQKKHISQLKLAELSGTTDRYIRKIEKGKSVNPSAIILYRICMVFGLHVEDFMMLVSEDEDDDLG